MRPDPSILPGRKPFSTVSDQWVTDGQSPHPLYAFDGTAASHCGIAVQEPANGSARFFGVNDRNGEFGSANGRHGAVTPNTRFWSSQADHRLKMLAPELTLGL